MGIYTAANNKVLDAKIQEHLTSIVEKICSYIQPISIILSGSFGRGEGCAILNGDKVKFISDYEIYIVSYKLKTRRIAAELSEILSKELGVETSISWMRPKRLYYNRNKNASLGLSRPSISMYELKAGSKVLYGRDLRKENQIEPEQIPLWEGILLLFNRMAESFSVLSNRDLYSEEKWMAKTLIACGDILLLDNKIYHYSYEERKKRLFTHLDIGKYPFLNTNQLEMIDAAYHMKMFGNYKKYESTELENIKQIVANVLRYSLQKEMSVVFTSYDTFPDRYLEVRRNFYACSAFHFYSLSHPIMENIIYLIKLVQWNRIPKLQVLSKINIPWHHLVYSVIPSLYFFESLSEEGQTKVTSYINDILFLFNTGKAEDIKGLREKILRLWFNFCFGKNV